MSHWNSSNDFLFITCAVVAQKHEASRKDKDLFNISISSPKLQYHLVKFPERKKERMNQQEMKEKERNCSKVI